LAQILFWERYNVRPEIRPLPLNAQAEEMETDAVLLIGDRAMKACLPGFRFAFDLGEEWLRWTGLPFVFAVWAVRSGVKLRGVDAALQDAKASGVENVGAIAQAEAGRLGLDAGFCRRYLETLLRFDLGAEELAGLKRYYELAVKLGLAPAGRSLEFYHDTSVVSSV
jgi:chorismate dehydratase